MYSFHKLDKTKATFEKYSDKCSLQKNLGPAVKRKVLQLAADREVKKEARKINKLNRTTY